MSPTKPHSSPQDGARSGNPVERAWISVALIPACLLVAAGLTPILYSALGYPLENVDAPLWVDLVTSIAAVAVLLMPCVAAVLYGRRASHAGDRRGLVPLRIALLAGVLLTALTFVSILGPFELLDLF